jgi:hypothetical protein
MIVKVICLFNNRVIFKGFLWKINIVTCLRTCKLCHKNLHKEKIDVWGGCSRE